jgi:hypothetical protein
VKHQAGRQQEHQKLYQQVISASLEWYGRLETAGLTLTEVQTATPSSSASRSRYRARFCSYLHAFVSAGREHMRLSVA